MRMRMNALILLVFAYSPACFADTEIQFVAVVREVSDPAWVYPASDRNKKAIPSPGFPISADDVVETGSGGSVVVLLDNFKLERIGSNQHWRYQPTANRILR